ncbi:MAG: hypothetical protein EPN93_14980 [Spirochaetes bacterium]|nr:MAG: hypothetical protein EPN93_14980 [Spirochaetota bacterium]
MKHKNQTAEKDYNQEFFETKSVTDFALKAYGKPPANYPAKKRADEYAPFPFAKDYGDRREAFFRHCLANPAGTGIKGYYYELVRLYKNKGPVHEGALRSALDYIDARYDCADFVMLGIMRLLYQFPGTRRIGAALMGRAERTILEFKYWPDEPGIDSMCTWTENHQIMFSANEYLAGQRFPDRVFENSGMTGIEKMQKARTRIMKWLELRYATGFSEWLSHVYYDEDITALVNLADFCADTLIAHRARIVLDLMVLDMALGSFKGVFGSTHGRSYAKEKRNALSESTTDTEKLLFGTGIFSGADNMSAVTLALSERYRLPRVICEIAGHLPAGGMENRQRMGIKLRESKRWGLDPKRPDDAMILLSLEAYTHPRTINAVMDLFDRYRWWRNNFFRMFASKKSLLKAMRATRLLPLLATIMEKDITRNTREEVNTYTFKTPDYMLSCAQDYRKGYGGDQQHIWQATLSPTAVCFTTHPGHHENTSGGYWVGSGTLPRAVQHRNVLIACYRASRMPGLYMTNRLFFTHAWFPRREFDEVREEGGWVFGRKGDGFIALFSRNGYAWQETGEDAGNEMIAPGRKNIWICEMGRRADDGPFDEFVKRIGAARLSFRGSRVAYDSPSLGEMRFGWSGPLRVNGAITGVHGYARFENPYARVPFPPGEIRLALGKHSLVLDFERGRREASGYV